ncbi:phage tail protein I [Pseudoalteromonas sp. JBTF-M23]|uniref:Phage tail protein I n=1 Tax=Pseudoalteromonas caenipelagi TaxID=2726988 RepID=A0A849VCS3_9GAMM|nr:phage tail protein I [Pseudoalteromonas caenipelagi]NOU49491.1 phage tail protein I [Pseudoalteromonas caenipelagi]
MDNFANLPKLLPSNASKLQQALTQLLTYPDQTQLLHDIWHPQKCPAQLLPWLAWSLSVDDWHDAWSEKNKRQVIADAFEVHRYKATPYALEKALDSLGIETDIQEWWQSEDAQRGTVVVQALVNQNLDTNAQGLLTKAMLQQVKRIVETAKRASVHVEVQLGISLKEQFGTGLFSGAGIGLASKDGAFNGVHPDDGALFSGAFLGAKQGVGASDKQAQFEGVRPNGSNGFLVAGFGAKAGIAAIDNDAQFKGIKPASSTAALGCALAGKSAIANCEYQAAWLGVKPEPAAISQGIAALLTRIQFNHLTLQGAT